MKRWIGVLSLALFLFGGLGIGAAQTPPPIVKTGTVTLVVQPAPDFTLAVTPASINTFPNRTVAYSVTLTGVNNFAGKIVLTVAGLPTGATATFLPSNTVTLGATPLGAQLNIAIPNDPALVKTWSIVVTATSTEYN